MVSGINYAIYGNRDAICVIHQRMGKNRSIFLICNNLGYNGNYHGYCSRNSIELTGDSLYDHDNFHHPPNVQFSNRIRELDDSKKIINIQIKFFFFYSYLEKTHCLFSTDLNTRFKTIIGLCIHKVKS